jgi:hypothetical protein
MTQHSQRRQCTNTLKLSGMLTPAGWKAASTCPPARSPTLVPNLQAASGVSMASDWIERVYTGADDRGMSVLTAS